MGTVLIKFAVQRESTQPETPFIVINQPWYFFYETNKWGVMPYRMTKPSTAQIE